MRLAAWLIVPLALLSLAFFLLKDVKGTFSTSGLAVGICQSNNEINPRVREELSSSTLAFLETFAMAPLQARQQMSRRGRAATVERGPIDAAAASYHSIEIMGEPTVTEHYFLRFAGGVENGPHVPCGFVEGRATFASRGGTNASAVVVVTEEIGGDSERTTTVWLEREQNAWRVRAVNWGISRIAGLDASELWNEAKRQRARGHPLNAALLYAAARSALERGGYYQHRLVQDFSADLNSFEAPSLVRGDAPFAWTFSDEAFEIRQVQYMGFGTGEVGLMIDYAPTTWIDDAAAEAANRRIIDGLNAQFPEWRETFDAIVVRAAKPNSNQTWGTVFRRDTGYQTAPAPG